MRIELLANTQCRCIWSKHHHNLLLPNELLMGSDSVCLRYQLRTHRLCCQSNKQGLLRLHRRIRMVFSVSGLRCQLQQCPLFCSRCYDCQYHRNMWLSSELRLDIATTCFSLCNRLQPTRQHSVNSEWVDWRVCLQIKVRLASRWGQMRSQLLLGWLHSMDKQFRPCSATQCERQLSLWGKVHLEQRRRSMRSRLQSPQQHFGKRQQQSKRSCEWDNW